VVSQLVAFAGTPEFAVPTLAALRESSVTIPLVLTQPDRPAGRGRRLRPSPVKEAALAAGLRVEQPQSLKSRETLADLTALSVDLLVVVAYGLILPQWVLDWPRLGAVNVHASLLPRWRGAAPIQRAILAGDCETGVSIMQMDRGLDTGPVYTTASVAIGPRDTAASLHEVLAGLGARALLGVLPRILDGSLPSTPQPASGASYAPKIEKSEALIDWHASAAEIDRQIRAFNPWPVAETRLSDGRRLRIWEAEIRDRPSDAEPGTVIATEPPGITVACGQRAICLTRIQAPSARAMEAAAYLAAQPLGGARFVD